MTMKTQQTIGRLQVHHDHGWLVIESDCGELYIKVEKGSGALKSMPHARRMVACWNACEGVPTELLEECPASFTELRGQRDELLTLLKQVVSSIDSHVDGALIDSQLLADRAAIAKTEEL